MISTSSRRKAWRASARFVSPSKSRYYATFARRVACALPSGRGAAIDVFRADLEACAPLRLRGPFDQNSLAACICHCGCLEPWLFAHLWRPGPGRALGETILRRLFSHLLDSGVARTLTPVRGRGAL